MDQVSDHEPATPHVEIPKHPVGAYSLLLILIILATGVVGLLFFLLKH